MTCVFTPVFSQVIKITNLFPETIKISKIIEECFPEYKIIDNTENKGVKLYKGNWKTEEVVESKILGMRCMACGYETDGGDIEGCSGVRIENKNVVFITDFWNTLGK